MKALLCWVGAVTFLVVVACTSSAPRCLVSNCDGCCDVNGMCQHGDQQYACGFGAQNCNSCAMNEACVDNQCQARDGGPLGGGQGGGGSSSTSDGGCGPSTCQGCCDPA